METHSNFPDLTSCSNIRCIDSESLICNRVLDRSRQTSNAHMYMTLLVHVRAGCRRKALGRTPLTASADMRHVLRFILPSTALRIRSDLSHCPLLRNRRYRHCRHLLSCRQASIGEATHSDAHEPGAPVREAAQPRPAPARAPALPAGAGCGAAGCRSAGCRNPTTTVMSSILPPRGRILRKKGSAPACDRIQQKLHDSGALYCSEMHDRCNRQPM